MSDQQGLPQPHQSPPTYSPVPYQHPAATHERQTPAQQGPTTPVPYYAPPLQQQHGQVNVMINNGSSAVRTPRAFQFDGGAGTYLGVGILAVLLTVCTLGFATPWATCLLYRWKTEHTIVEGRRLHFTGSGAELFGMWIVWFLLMVVTLGIYGFWVYPRVTKWCVEHQEF